MTVYMQHRGTVLINRVSRLIGERRLTVKEVALGCGVSRRTMHELYHGRTTRIDLDTLNRLCAYFDVTADQVFEFRRREDDPAPQPLSPELGG